MGMEKMSAAVLAGGYSRRMGRDKATLLLGGMSLIELQVAKLRKLGIRDLMLSGYDKQLEDCRNVADVYPHRGPLSGVHACLAAAEYDTCLFLSVDMPLISENTLRELIDTHQGGGTVLEHSGRIEPLAAVYDRALCGYAEQILQTEKTAIMRLLDHATLTKMRYEGDERLLTNCNTPEDYEVIQTIWKEAEKKESCMPSEREREKPWR